MSRKKKSDELEQRQKEAERALAASKANYRFAQIIGARAESIQKRHIQLQEENGFGYRIFGVE